MKLLDSSTTIASAVPTWRFKFRSIAELTKARLNMSVVYSALAGYFLGASSYSLVSILLVSLGGYLVVGAANGFNQIIERDRDRLMKRTQNRPLPTGRLSVGEAMVASTVMAIAGLVMLYFINVMTFTFGAIALFMYVVMYTPLKAGGPLAVFVGAVPGALPALLGWVAATNDFGIEAGTLFAIQFLWQFAHFWAIAWVADEDYKKAGYSLLPSGQRDTRSIFQILIYIVFLVLLTLLPYFGITGALQLSLPAAIGIGILGIGFLIFGILLAYGRQISDARKLMIYSVIYLPLLQLIYVLDKLI